MFTKNVFWIVLVLMALLTAGCSADKNDSGQSQATMPPPNVRVEQMPTASPAPTQLAAAEITPTPEPGAATGQVYQPAPTPDDEALIIQIEAYMDEIDRELRSQDLLLKP